MSYKTDTKKNETISLRCTKEEKEKIYRKAKSLNKSANEYVLNCSIAGTERRSSKEKKMLIKDVQVTEELNQIHYVFDRYKDELPEEFISEMDERIKSLGGICKCQY